MQSRVRSDREGSRPWHDLGQVPKKPRGHRESPAEQAEHVGVYGEQWDAMGGGRYWELWFSFVARPSLAIREGNEICEPEGCAIHSRLTRRRRAWELENSTSSDTGLDGNNDSLVSIKKQVRTNVVFATTFKSKARLVEAHQ